MMSLSAAREAMPLSFAQQKQKALSSIATLSRRAKRLLPVCIAIGWGAVGIGMVLITISSIHPAGKASHASITPTPKSVTPTVAPASCQNSQADASQVFAACPTFSQDYSKQSTGIVSSQIYNIATGKPEANQEAQLYTANSQNLRIENGSLVLQALNDPQQGFSYTSARIDTKGKEDFLYGRIVVRATLPSSIGTWPAIWMLPSQSKYAALSPVTDTNRYLNDGEIDIAESVGTEAHRVYGIAHSLAYPEDGPDRSYYSVVRVPDNDTVFHNYEIDWTPTNLTFSVDGKAYFSISKQAGADYRSWPYDQPFYLILNLAIGGAWGGTDRAQFPTDGVDKSALPASLNVQSINYYPYIGK